MEPEHAERPRPLREIEIEVEAESREWGRQRLQQRLQEEASRHGGVSPRSRRPVVHRRERPMRLRTQFGVVELRVVHGQDPGDRHWGCPIREWWGLGGHQQLSLAFQDKLAFTATATAPYAEATALAGKWGAPAVAAGGGPATAAGQPAGCADDRRVAGAAAGAGMGPGQNDGKPCRMA